jgi:hypothetical protein
VLNNVDWNCSTAAIAAASARRRLSRLLGKLHPSKVHGKAEKTEHGNQTQRGHD